MEIFIIILISLIILPNIVGLFGAILGLLKKGKCGIRYLNDNGWPAWVFCFDCNLSIAGAHGVIILIPCAAEKEGRWLQHEYGHVLQYLIWLPLYYPVVGLMSLYRLKTKTDGWPEDQATRWGEKRA